MVDGKRGSVSSKGLFGIFSYFAQIDIDGSGFLEINEIEELAKQIFGEDRAQEVQTYVVKVFEEFDTDNSGELSYEEARSFIRGIYSFFESGGKLTEAEKRKLLGILEACEDEGELAEDGSHLEAVAEANIEPTAAAGVSSAPAGPTASNVVAPDIVGQSTPNISNNLLPADQPNVAEVNGQPLVGARQATGSAEGHIAGNTPAAGGSGNISENIYAENIDGQHTAQSTGIVAADIGLATGNKPAQKSATSLPAAVDGSSTAAPGSTNESTGSAQVASVEQPKVVKIVPVQLTPKEPEPIENKPVEIVFVRPPVIAPEPSDDVKALLQGGEPKLGPFGELLDAEGKQVLGPFGEILGPDGKSLLGEFGQIRGPDGNSLLGKFGELLGPDGKSLLGDFGQLLGADGKSLLGKFGEILDADGKAILGKCGEILGPDGPCAILGPSGEILGPDGKPLHGQFGHIIGPGGATLLGVFGQILQDDGKSLLGKFGELLGPDGKALLGPNGELLGPDGKPLGPPLLGADGKPLLINGEEPKIVTKEEMAQEAVIQPSASASVSHAAPSTPSDNAAGKNSGITTDQLMANAAAPRKSSVQVEEDPNALKQWDQYVQFKDGIPMSTYELKKEARRKKQAFIDQLKAARPEGNDGFDQKLGIFKPKPSIQDLSILPEDMAIDEKDVFFRDPVTKQWISKKQLNPETAK